MSIPKRVECLAGVAQRILAVRESMPSTLPPGTTDEAIDAFEARHGLILPLELREWLRFTNGPSVGAGRTRGIRTTNPANDIEALWLPGWRRRGWIPIASDGCGSHYVLATRPEDGPGHPVFFLDHERQQDEDRSTPTYVCASCLWSFLCFYLMEDGGVEGWPFNRYMVLADDPALAHYSKVRRAWEVDEAD